MAFIASLEKILFIAILIIGAFSAANSLYDSDLQTQILEEFEEEPISTGANLGKAAVGYDNIVPSYILTLGEKEILVPLPSLHLV